jgi:hypothetical protein
MKPGFCLAEAYLNTIPEASPAARRQETGDRRQETGVQEFGSSRRFGR